jgi:hypothetical protein
MFGFCELFRFLDLLRFIVYIVSRWVVRGRPGVMTVVTTIVVEASHGPLCVG